MAHGRPITIGDLASRRDAGAASARDWRHIVAALATTQAATTFLISFSSLGVRCACLLGVTVAVYRFYYLNSADRVASVEVFHCDNDVDARARADRLLASSNHAAIDVWDRIQVVYRARKSAPPPE